MKSRFYASCFFFTLFMAPYLLWAESNGNPAFTGSNESPNLTDQEWQTSRQFVHEGKADRELEEKCTGEIGKACRGEDASGNYKIVEMAGKAYTMVMGAGLGDKFSYKNKEEQTDYCRFIAVGTEAVATFQQVSAQKNLQNTIAPDEQKQIAQLKNAKASHEERAKTAKIQAVGWTASSACYLAQMTYSAGAAIGGNPLTGGSWALVALKLAATTTFAGFSWGQVSAHEDYALKTDTVIKGFESVKGNCNPVTDKECYCQQPETENDPQYCAGQLHTKKVTDGNMRMSCVDAALKADPKCSCITSNSCFDTAFYGASGGMNFGHQTDFIKKMVGDLSRGELSGGGKLNGNSLRQNAMAHLRNNRSELSKMQPPENTSAQAIKDAKLLAKMADLPDAAALAIAAAPMDPGAQQQINALKSSSPYFSKFNLDSLSAGQKSNNGNVMYFGGQGINRNKNTNDSGPGIDLSMFKPKKNEPNAGKGGNILDFANKAQQQAQITRQSDRNLFEIITRRYQVTSQRLTETPTP